MGFIGTEQAPQKHESYRIQSQVDIKRIDVGNPCLYEAMGNPGSASLLTLTMDDVQLYTLSNQILSGQKLSSKHHHGL
jgi:tRNA 2-selenouridine synthase SelU